MKTLVWTLYGLAAVTMFALMWWHRRRVIAKAHPDCEMCSGEGYWHDCAAVGSSDHRCDCTWTGEPETFA